MTVSIAGDRPHRRDHPGGHLLRPPGAARHPRVLRGVLLQDQEGLLQVQGGKVERERNRVLSLRGHEDGEAAAESGTLFYPDLEGDLLGLKLNLRAYREGEREREREGEFFLLGTVANSVPFRKERGKCFGKHMFLSPLLCF